MDPITMLDQLARQLNDTTRVYRAGVMAAEMIRGHIRKASGWSPLAPATVDYRGQGRPLQDTGALRDSINAQKVDERTVSVGTNKPQAPLLNSGGVIRAKKNWLWIPAAGVRPLQRRYGYSPTDVLAGLKAAGYSVFRKGRTMCYRSKRKTGGKYTDHVLYYLKKSVEIPARPFFYLTDQEMNLLMEEAGIGLEQL